MARGLSAARIALATAALSACGVNNHYYVKTDGSADVLAGITELTPPARPPAPIDLGVTFKSAGKVTRPATDALYQSVSQGLSAKGQWQVHRLGGSGDDFTPAIADVIRALAAGAGAGTGSAAGSIHAAPAGQRRLLVLVENAPDQSFGTELNYFFSGMTFGLRSLHKPTDRYDATVAYRDAAGTDHVYRSHQDLIYAASSRLVDNEDQALDAIKPAYDSPFDAFNSIVTNTVSGARHKSISVGKPQQSPPEPPAAPAQPRAGDLPDD